MLGAEEHDGAVGLRVEGRGDLVDQVLDDLLDAGGRDGQVLGQRVVGPALLGEVDEVLGGGGHLAGGGREGSTVVVEMKRRWRRSSECAGDSKRRCYGRCGSGGVGGGEDGLERG